MARYMFIGNRTTKQIVMKALTNKNRILTTIGLLLLAVTIGNGQDFYADASMELSNLNLHAPIVETSVVNSIAAENAEDCCTSDSDSYIESELKVEVWMEESFSESVEVEIEVESWMSESFSESVEAEIEVESWMAKSFSSSLETQIEAEEWMTVSFTETTEEGISVEDWMTASLITN